MWSKITPARVDDTHHHHQRPTLRDWEYCCAYYGIIFVCRDHDHGMAKLGRGKPKHTTSLVTNKALAAQLGKRERELSEDRF